MRLSVHVHKIMDLPGFTKWHVTYTARLLNGWNSRVLIYVTCNSVFGLKFGSNIYIDVYIGLCSKVLFSQIIK